ELYPAFDAAISATGYNTAMELLHFGIPTAFVPFPRQVDDQEARAQKIESAGAGICLPNLDAESLREAVRRLLDPAESGRIRESAGRRVLDSGATRAAEAIVGFLG